MTAPKPADQLLRSGPAPRPQVIPKADFVALAELAYRIKPKRSLSGQMAEILSMSPQSGEKTCLRWLSEDGPPPPFDVVSTTWAYASDTLKARRELIDKLEEELRDYNIKTR